MRGRVEVKLRQAALGRGEVRVTGDWAYCRTDLTLVVTPITAGAPVRRSGHTLSIFQKLADGRWVLARDANLLTVQEPGGKK